MVGTLLSVNPAIIPVTTPHGVTLVGLLLVAIFPIGAGLNDVSFGYLVPMGPTVSFIGETAVHV